MAEILKELRARKKSRDFDPYCGTQRAIAEHKGRVVSGFPGSCPIGPENSIPARHEYIYSRFQPIFSTLTIYWSSRTWILSKMSPVLTGHCDSSCAYHISYFFRKKNRESLPQKTLPRGPHKSIGHHLPRRWTKFHFHFL